MHVSCIILARGGSKGIPKKNIINFCGKPLLAWTILQAKACKSINSIWVSSDSEEILDVAKKFGAECISRPIQISTDRCRSEAAWKHALDVINMKNYDPVDYVIAPQVTSPLRETKDFTLALSQLISSKKDSMLTVSEVEDYFNWKLDNNGIPFSHNHDFKSRKPRQLIEKNYLENGSFYIFKPEILLSNDNRLGGMISLYVMDRYKMFQIDNADDAILCEIIMKGFGLDRL